jgi:hypothetical protein
MYDHEILYSDRSSDDEQLLIRTFLWKTKNMNMAGSWYLKSVFYFMVTTYEPLHLDERSFVQWKMVDIPTSFVWIIISCNWLFEYGDGGIFKLLRWMQNLHQSTCIHKILYADRSLEDE